MPRNLVGLRCFSGALISGRGFLQRSRRDRRIVVKQRNAHECFARFFKIAAFELSIADEQTRLRTAARLWARGVSAVFLAEYLEAARGAPAQPPGAARGSKGSAPARPAPIVPSDPETAQVLLDTFLIEKAAYELAYELNNRPAWVWIPLLGIITLLGRQPE